MTSIAERLASFTDELRMTDLPPGVVDFACWLVADTFACAIAAAAEQDEGAVQILRDYAATDRLRPEATVIGTCWKTSLRSAAMANCAMARYLDANDIYIPTTGPLSGSGHFSDAVPAIFATAEMTGATGRAFVEAVIVAYEVQAALADSLAWLDQGFHSVSQVTVAVALSAGRLLGLDQRQLATAASLAITSGLFLQSWLRPGAGVAAIKSGSPGLAAERGILCAELAGSGFTAPITAFETFFDLFGDASSGQPTSFDGLGSEWRTRRNAIKPAPAQIYTQAVIQCGRALYEGGLRIDTLDELTIYSNDGACGRVQGSPGAYRPDSREAADHSTPFVTVMALRDGMVTIDSYRDRIWELEETRHAMERIKLVTDRDWTERLEREGVLGAAVEATDLDGRRYRARVEQFRGHPDNPLSRQELVAKIEGFIGDGSVPGSKAGATLLDLCERLPAAKNLDDIIHFWGLRETESRPARS